MDPPQESTTALSPGVYRLIVESGITRKESSEKYLNDFGTLDWKAVQAALPHSVIEENTEYFQASVYNMAPIFKQAEDILSVLTSEEFSNKYQENLEWIECNQLHICIDVFTMLRNKSEAKTLLAVQLLTSTIERALGNVFLHQSSAQCPSMLKDLLTSSEINSIFGPVVIQVLRTVIGPPISLNLRNIVWHGFCKPGEISSRYGWFLLLILPSLGKILKDKSVTVSGHRSPVVFLEVEQYHQLLTGIAIEDCEKDLLCLNGVFDGRESLVLAAVEHYKCKEYGFAASLLLPQLEHALRCIYGVINKCPERIMTAEATTLYTTFDEILDCHLPNNDMNILKSYLGESYMDMLHDLLVYPEGPRVRDRLSHGEVDWYTFPKELALCIILTASLLTTQHQVNKGSTKNMSCQNTSTYRIEESYQSMFHPVSIVKRMVRDLMYDVNTINRRIKYTSGLLLRSNQDDNILCDIEDQSLFSTIRGDILFLTDHICSIWSVDDVSREEIHGIFSLIVDNKVVVDKLLRKRISTLYLFQKQEYADRRLGEKVAEKVSLLKHILTECLTVVNQLNHTLTNRQEQFEAKQLRSRQRANLQNLIGSCPFLHHIIQLIALIIIWQIHSFHQISERISRYHDIKFFKSTLQLAENLRTNTKVDKNKWKESIKLCSSYVQRLKEVFTKL